MSFFNNKHQIAVQPMYEVGCLDWLLSLHQNDVVPGIVWSDDPDNNHYLTEKEWKKFFTQTDELLVAVNSVEFRNPNFHSWLSRYRPKYIEFYSGLSGKVKQIGTESGDDKVFELFNTIGAKSYAKSINNSNNDDAYIKGIIDRVDAVNVKNNKAAGYTNDHTLRESIEWAKAKFDKPVIASGGLSNKKDIEEARSYGADAVMMGTIFAVARESNLSQKAKELLIEKTSNDLKRYGMNKQSAIGYGELIQDDDGNMNKNYKKLARHGEEGIIFAGHGINSISSIRPIKEIVKDLLF